MSQSVTRLARALVCTGHYEILNEWQSKHVSLKDSIEKAKKSDWRQPSRHSWTIPPAPNAGELDISIMDVYHSAAVAKEAAEAREDGMELWRTGLHFSILRGGITSERWHA